MCSIPWPAGHSCGECGAPATVAYGMPGEDRYACDGHDPLRYPLGAVVNIPWGWHYSKMTALGTVTGVLPLGTSAIAPGLRMAVPVRG
jgi:hypothetical protein